MSEAMDTESRSDAGYEKKDLDPRAIALFAAGGAAVLVFSAVLAFWMVQSVHKQHAGLQSQRSAAPTREAAPPPRLQVQGSNELAQMRKAEEGLLNTYGWLDREKGLVRIPIERAMELLARANDRRESKGKKEK